MHEEPWLPSDKPQQQVAIEDQVRPWVLGMKALVISNRMDPELEVRLSQKLGLDITWAICDVRRAQAQAKSIARRGYDLVIAQTGFLPHKIESIIAPACSAHGIPYIRADKARPTSTARALIRDLGLDLSKEPPKHDRVVVSAPPMQSRNGRVRRRTIVTLPRSPEDYKDLDIDVLKFLERQESYFRMADLLRSLPGVPLITGPDGKINYGKMRLWTSAIGAILQKLNYVNTQIPQAVDPKRPRVWVRRDKQRLLRLPDQRTADRTPAEIARSQPEPQPRVTTPSRSRPRARPSSFVRTEKFTPTRNSTGQKWLRKYEKAVRSHARDKMYVHPEDILRMLGVNLPPTKDIVWQEFMFWTKNVAPILRKMGFTPRQREFSGRKTRVWIHKKAPRYMYVSPPGREYIAPSEVPVPEPKPRSRSQQPPVSIPLSRAAASPPVAQAPAPPLPAVSPATGPKSVRVSYSSLQGGSMEEITLLLTQAGWSVSFGP